MYYEYGKLHSISGVPITKINYVPIQIVYQKLLSMLKAMSKRTRIPCSVKCILLGL